MMRLNVTRTDIDAAARVRSSEANATSCPVAQALHRAFARKKLKLKSNTIIAGSFYLWAGSICIIATPPHVQRFMNTWDLHNAVEPISFDVPDDKIEEIVRTYNAY